MRGDYSYAFGDRAMNHLFIFAYGSAGPGLPAFAWKVYGAFDEGEYDRPGEAAESQGEARTKALLDRVRQSGSA